MPNFDASKLVKVVHRSDDGRLTSLQPRPPLCVEYKIGEWVRAPIGGLLCMQPSISGNYLRAKIAWAQDEAHLNKINFPIYFVEARGPVSLPYRRLCIDTIYTWLLQSYADRQAERLQSSAEKLWTEPSPMICRPSGGQFWEAVDWPMGTVAFQEVKLVEQLTLEDLDGLRKFLGRVPPES
jgi:hypothetical protein